MRTCSLGTPEHSERDQHDSDGELHAVLGHPRQRRPHRHADNGYHQYGGDRGSGGQWNVVLIGAEGQGDECDFQALKQDALVRQREGVPVEHLAAALNAGPPGRRERRLEHHRFVVQRLVPAGAQDGLA